MKKFTSISLALLAALASTAALAQNTPVIPSPTGARAPGLYVAVLDGLIKVTNPAGTTNFAAGQFGYTASPMQVPAMVPKNPGLPFTLPRRSTSRPRPPARRPVPGPQWIASCAKPRIPRPARLEPGLSSRPPGKPLFLRTRGFFMPSRSNGY